MPIAAQLPFETGRKGFPPGEPGRQMPSMIPVIRGNDVVRVLAKLGAALALMAMVAVAAVFLSVAMGLVFVASTAALCVGGSKGNRQCSKGNEKSYSISVSHGISSLASLMQNCRCGIGLCG